MFFPIFTGRLKMRFDRKSADYEANIEGFEDMNLYVSMTRVERNALRSWARKDTTSRPIHGDIRTATDGPSTTCRPTV